MSERNKTPTWSTPRGFDITTVALDLGGSPRRKQTVVAIVGHRGHSIARAVMQTAATSQAEHGDEGSEAVLAAMLLVVRQDATNQSRWPIRWGGELIADKTRHRRLSAAVDMNDLAAFLEPETGGRDLSDLSQSIISSKVPGFRLRQWTEIENAHSLARWNALPLEYGAPSEEDVSWVEAKAREILRQFKAAPLLDTTALLNREINDAASIGGTAGLSRLAAWRLLIEAGSDSLLHGREFLYRAALNDLVAVADLPTTPPKVALATRESRELHELFYFRSSDFAGELFYFDGWDTAFARQRFPRLVDVACDLWGAEWLTALFRAVADGDANGKASLITDYHALAAVVAWYRATRGEMDRRAPTVQDKQTGKRIRAEIAGPSVTKLIDHRGQGTGMSGSSEGMRHPDREAHDSILRGRLEAEIGGGRDFRILYLNRVEGRTFDEIGKMFGISRARAQQLCRRAEKRAAESRFLRELWEDPVSPDDEHL